MVPLPPEYGLSILDKVEELPFLVPVKSELMQNVAHRPRVRGRDIRREFAALPSYVPHCTLVYGRCLAGGAAIVS